MSKAGEKRECKDLTTDSHSSDGGGSNELLLRSLSRCRLPSSETKLNVDNDDGKSNAQEAVLCFLEQSYESDEIHTRIAAPSFETDVKRVSLNQIDCDSSHNLNSVNTGMKTNGFSRPASLGIDIDLVAPLRKPSISVHSKEYYGSKEESAICQTQSEDKLALTPLENSQPLSGTIDTLDNNLSNRKMSTSIFSSNSNVDNDDHDDVVPSHKIFFDHIDGERPLVHHERDLNIYENHPQMLQQNCSGEILHSSNSLSTRHGNNNNSNHHHHHPLILSSDTSLSSTHCSREVLRSDSSPVPHNINSPIPPILSSIIPPPRTSEPTAREQLIERERRSRLERERARLKRQLALSRERDEEEQAFAAVDVARMNGIGSDNDDDEDNSHGRRMTIIRSRSGDSGTEEVSRNSIISIQSLVSSDVEKSDDHDNASNLPPPNSGIGVPVVTGVGVNMDIAAAVVTVNNHNGSRTERSATNPSPLGFTMERFLSDGVVVSEGSGGGDDREGGEDGEGSERRNKVGSGISQGNGGEGDNSVIDNATVINVTQQHQDLIDHHHHLQLITPPEGVEESFETFRSGGGIDIASIVTSDPGLSSEISRINSSEVEVGSSSSSRVASRGAVVVGTVSGSGGVLVPGMGMGLHPGHHDPNIPQENLLYHEPRLAQLTEAEILEMAEIDYASVGNMPPRSVREEHYDLLSSFPDDSGSVSSGMRIVRAFSEGTQTTLQESVSVTSAGIPSCSSCDRDGCAEVSSMVRETNTADGEGGERGVGIEDCSQEDEKVDVDDSSQSKGVVASLHDEVVGIMTLTAVDACESRPQNLRSPGDTSNASILVQRSEESDNGDEGNPSSQMSPSPSPIAKPLSVARGSLKWQNEDGDSSHPSIEYIAKAVPSISSKNKDGGTGQLKDPREMFSSTHSSTDSHEHPKRRIRSGMLHNNSDGLTSADFPIHRRAQTTPIMPNYVDDFDFCKFKDVIPKQPSDLGASFQLMSQNTYVQNNPAIAPLNSNYCGKDYNSTGGVMKDSAKATTPSPVNIFDVSSLHEENMYAIGSRSPSDYKSSSLRNAEAITSIPSYKCLSEELVESRPLIDTKQLDEFQNYQNGPPQYLYQNRTKSLHSIFSLETDDDDKYLASSILSRAFLKRFNLNLVTILIEIPVLLMISLCSSNICALIGQKRYQILMGYLPLFSVISGSCGLQASVFATKAISHLHIIKESYFSWMMTELKVVSLLGAAIGVGLGIFSYFTSGLDFTFAFIIFVANLLHMVYYTACCLCLVQIEAQYYSVTSRQRTNASPHTILGRSTETITD